MDEQSLGSKELHNFNMSFESIEDILKSVIDHRNS